MIELVSHDRCIQCDICVAACPDNVFDAMPDAPPVIARQGDCQTCFLCELYCPVDALYVSPLTYERDVVSEADLVARGVLGSFRREMGWRNAKPRGTRDDLSYRIFEAGTIVP
ncbi:4Fe-4S dicluster domain-containing protein [Aureimonas jatrophae]|uniref:NAD-dependent dihydropyrimidine dehydrogenase, PreA subunit n=1 Tax=Aureimonas jatrophae TaxID=1166073 RepID=A0A1H0MKR7_9HYPH|nr:ferredoxin family protein [Aureimonas jatrophae]MBB3952912.1 NAD-dependent dihydropyrimidine dehydrogenase PreA subunit [Aureimonas jatrophae]SDO80905.1 NAD-dependent dihydropyrimidine dehydrogenase, PreA subunit [Aureimonas jatrophae]